MTQSSQFPLDQARELVKGLNAPNPWIYWTDFLFHVTLGWAAFILALRSPLFSVWQVVFYLVATLALYRAVIFTHELAHLRRTTFRLFRLVWNLTCGFPLMVPSFMYGGVHNDHHKRNVYGTRDDGEYLPFAVKPPFKIVLYLMQVCVLPLLLAGRFILLTPLSYLNGRLRRLVWESASSLTIDFGYRRPEPSSRDEETWRWQEFATFLYGATAVTLVAAGLWPWRVLLLWYLVSVLMFLLNSLRTLAAHSYRNPGDRTMEFTEQYLDSVNVPGNPVFTTLWAPVGLRYHATHHLFPALPYHALGKAHRRLVRELPDNTLYLQTLRNSLWDALRRLWRESRTHQHGASTTPA
jgi:fatty acid desaturase